MGLHAYVIVTFVGSLVAGKSIDSSFFEPVGAESEPAWFVKWSDAPLPSATDRIVRLPDSSVTFA